MEINGNFTGKHIEETDSGKIYISFIDGKKSGITKFVNKDGVILSEIEYKNDIIDGHVKQYYISGNIMAIISYKNGTQDGKFTTFYENGLIQFEANYVKGEFDGTFVTYDEFGDKISELSYKNGKKHGKSVTYYPKSNGGGPSEISTYENGLLHGDRISLYPTGEFLSVTPYIEGKAQEYTKTYNKNGNVIL
jgi:antitoxin component YwqK of YwqJK toxin-antitoxin module